MAAPWEKYGAPAPAAAGPWGKYGGSAPQADFTGTTGRSTSTEPQAERDRNGQLTDFGRRVAEQQRQDRETYNPAAGQSGWDNFRAGFGKSIADTGRGIYQAGVDAANRSTMIGATALDAIGADQAAGALVRNVGAPLNAEARQLEADEAERRRLDAPLMDTKAGLGGNIAGTVAQFIGPGIYARGTLAARALLPRTVLGNAALGAVTGFLQPNTGAGDQAVATGAGLTLGGAGALLPRAAVATGGYLNRLRTGLDPLTQRAGAQLRDAVTNPAALRFEQSGIPGVNRTIGEATTDPGLQGLERTLRQQNQGVFQGIDRANNAARMEFVEELGGTSKQYTDAVDFRDTAGSTARKEAMQAGPVDISGTAAKIDELISAQEGRPAVQDGLRTIRGLLVKDVESVPGLVTADTPESRLFVLDNARQTIGDMLAGKYGGDSSKALQGSRTLIELRDALNKEIGDQVPAFTDYLNAYRNFSGPIERMDMWRQVASRASGLPEAGTTHRTMTPHAFDSTTRDLDALAAKATGFSKAKASEIFEAQDFDAISRLTDDFARIQSRNRSPATGSNTPGHLVNLARLMGRGATSGTPLVGKSVDAALGALDGATQQKVLYLATNPAEAERVLRAMPSKDRETLQTLLAQIAVSGSGQSARVTGTDMVR